MNPKQNGPVWTDKAGLPADLWAGLERAADQPRVLAWGEGADGLVVAALTGGLAVHEDGQWRVHPWHEIGQARWDAEAGRLSWTTPEGGAEAMMTTPRRVPQVVKDRVEASLVVDDRLTAPGNVPVIITARRDLAAPDRPLIWAVGAVDGRTLDRPGVREAAEARLVELKAELPL